SPRPASAQRLNSSRSCSCGCDPDIPEFYLEPAAESEMRSKPCGDFVGACVAAAFRQAIFAFFLCVALPQCRHPDPKPRRLRMAVRDLLFLPAFVVCVPPLTSQTVLPHAAQKRAPATFNVPQRQQ